MEDAIPVLLEHLGVDVEAGVAELGDLLGQKLDSVGGVAEDNRLVDLQLGEEGVEAVHLRRQKVRSGRRVPRAAKACAVLFVRHTFWRSSTKA